MKRALVCSAAIALAAFAPRASDAKCAYESVRAFPLSRAHLPLNGRIVVEGYGESQAMVKEIAAYHPELWSADDRVALRVRNTNVGAFRLTQVVLVPERTLLPKTKYTLRLYDPAHAVGDESQMKLRETFAWTTAGGADHAAPRWQAAPSAAERVYRAMGCGPESYVKITVDVADPNPVQVLAEVRPVDGGPASRYLLEPQDGVVQIGHGMCSGPFELADNKRYDVTLTAFDVAGNATPAPGTALRIVAPSPENETP